MHTGVSITPESIETYVAYDGETGDIYHVHDVVTFKGGQRLDVADVHARVCAIAERHLESAKTLQVLQVDRGVLRPGTIYAVDVEQRCLVAGRHVGRPPKQHP